MNIFQIIILFLLAGFITVPLAYIIVRFKFDNKSKKRNYDISKHLIGNNQDLGYLGFFLQLDILISVIAIPVSIIVLTFMFFAFR